MIAVLSHLISEQFEKATGIKALPLKPYQRLDAPVAAHADMLLCVIEKNLFCYKDYYQENIGLFNKIEKEGYKVIQIEKECNKLYPKDIALNVLIIGNMLFCNKKYTASEILEFAEKNKYIIINVNQGYSACSTLVVDKKTVITADIGIKRALEKENIEVHLICAKEIKLPGYDCGFIGGSGVVIGDTLYTFGSISNLSDAVKIENALTGKNIKIKEIIPDDVCDFGGVKIFWMHIWGQITNNILNGNLSFRKE